MSLDLELEKEKIKNALIVFPTKTSLKPVAESVKAIEDIDHLVANLYSGQIYGMSPVFTCFKPNYHRPIFYLYWNHIKGEIEGKMP